MNTAQVCAIFRPVPAIYWSRDDVVSLPTDRFLLLEYNTQLTIVNITRSDEAIYRCTTNNSNVTVIRSIAVTVEGLSSHCHFHSLSIHLPSLSLYNNEE